MKLQKLQAGNFSFVKRKIGWMPFPNYNHWFQTVQTLNDSREASIIWTTADGKIFRQITTSSSEGFVFENKKC